MKKNDLVEAEVFNEKVRITSEKNQHFIFEKIKQISQGKVELIDSPELNKFESPPPSDIYKKDKYYNKQIIISSNSAFNWTYKNRVPYKVNYKCIDIDEEKDLLNIKKKKNELCLYNTRIFYGQNQENDFIDNYKLIISKKNTDINLFLLELKYLLRE